MNFIDIGQDIGLIFAFSFLFLLCLRKLAPVIGLLDKPNERKRHAGVIPLVGGLSVFFGLCFAFYMSGFPLFKGLPYLICASILVFVGVLDDRFDISFKFRLVIQGLLGVITMYYSGLSLTSLGYILGPWEIHLGFLGYVVTIFAVWGAINAFNMIDGIDGLLGGLACVSFTALGIVFYFNGQSTLAFWAFAVTAALLPYLILNLECLGKRFKVFMGDAGSTLLGFIAIWLLLKGSQGEKAIMAPVTALWIIAIPLMDMIAVMYRRMRKGKSPFSADRQHLHHLLIRAGFSARQACALIVLSAVILASIGLVGEYLNVPESLSLALFLFAFFIYGFCLKKAWKLARFIRRAHRRMRCKKL